MQDINYVVDRIKILECPTGQLESRVIGILKDYNIATEQQVKVERDKESDVDNSLAFRVRFENSINNDIVILAKSGMDDYVAKVVDAYVE